MCVTLELLSCQGVPYRPVVFQVSYFVYFRII